MTTLVKFPCSNKKLTSDYPEANLNGKLFLRLMDPTDPLYYIMRDPEGENLL